MNAYRVLIADDHPMARMAIRSLLDPDPSFEVIGEAENGEEAFCSVDSCSPIWC